MSLLALGLNHHTAPVDIRERVAIGDTQLNAALLALKDVDAVNEAAIVSTCNRTEIYCGMRTGDTSQVMDWMNDYLHLDSATMQPYLFQHADEAVVQHLMRVCSGLDSLILGEPQILGQIKQAYRDAGTVGTLGAELSGLFETAFSVAKLVRSDTAIGNSPVSVAFAAVSLARQIFEDFSKQQALLIGAGDTIQLTARHLQSNSIGSMIIANRTTQRAATLADEVGGKAVALNTIPDVLAESDIIISSTGSPLPILGKGAMEVAMKKRRYRPVLIVDIAVPRDVEPQVAEINNVFVYTVDDLAEVIEENRQSRRAAADQAEQIIRDQVEVYMRRSRALGARDTIKSYRDAVEATRDELLVRAKKQLSAGRPADEVIQLFAHSFSNKIMHPPTTRLREAAEQGNSEFIDAARILLDLPPPK